MASGLGLESCRPELESRFNCNCIGIFQLSLFQLLPCSTPRLPLYRTNWSACWILNLLSCVFVLVALKSPGRDWSIKSKNVNV